MRRDPSNADSETYELKIALFENGQPEGILALMKNFKSEIDRTGNTSAAGKINYIRTLLYGEALQEFDKVLSQNTGTITARLKFTHVGFLGVFILTPFPNRSA